MQFTIGRIRKLLLGTGILLVVALAVFLGSAKWRSGLMHRDLPRKLGSNIQQESNSVTYTQAHAGRTLFTIHASRVIQLRDNRALLHNVSIEFYGPDGKRTDKIEGNEFEYNRKTGLATAAGPVSITLVRPPAPPTARESPSAETPKSNPLASAAQAATTGEIQVETSGLTFNQKTGVATTAKPVKFSMAQGSGSAMGATYDSQRGYLVLNRDVALTTRRGGQTVVIHARHAQFQRDGRLCTLLAATAEASAGNITAAKAEIIFRNDGSAARLDSSGGVTLATASGTRLTAPTGTMDFSERNQPRSAYLQGGVTMDAASPGRTLHGTSPIAQLAFTPQGELRSAHLERGVELRTEERGQPAAGAPAAPPPLVRRTWRSPVADIEFRGAGHGRVEPASIRGTGGVAVTTQTRTGAAPPASLSLAADQVAGTFGAGSALTALTGVGHARMESTSTAGIQQTASADRLVAHFAPAGAAHPAGGSASAPSGPVQMQSAQLDGHVVLVDQPAAHPGAANARPRPPMRATAGRADYDGASERLRLTLAPRVENGDLQVTANAIDVSQDSGDAFAHGNVKATWTRAGTGAPDDGQNGGVLDGQGPAHAIAENVQLSHATGEATFRGHVRLWQQDNSVSGPLVILDRRNQTLVATSANPSNPVELVLVNAGSLIGLETSGRPDQGSGDHGTGKPAPPAVVRVRGGSLWYSAAGHKAIMRGGALGSVFATTATATSTSGEVELLLAPPAHPSGNGAGQAQVDRLTASGRVVLTFQGRRATGQQLVYTSQTGDYVLTGTPAAPPRMTDPQRGSVSGKALIFHSRDDSVSIEGRGRETTAETTAPR